MVNKCKSAMLNSDMTLSRLMTHALKIDEQKVKTRERQNKRARAGSFNFAQPKSEGGNRSQFQNYSSMPTPSSAGVLGHKIGKSSGVSLLCLDLRIV